MGRRLRLGIDLDGVVANFNVGWVDRYNEHFQASLREAHVVNWDSPLELTHFRNMDDFWTWAQAGEASIFRSLPPYEDSLETLERLAESHQIVIITAKFDWAIPDTLAWIAQHRIPAREIHFAWEKWRVPCDVYLEDAPHNLEEIPSHRPEAVVCRMVRPWNHPQGGTVDVESWKEFGILVDTVAAEGVESIATQIRSEPTSSEPD